MMRVEDKIKLGKDHIFPFIIININKIFMSGGKFFQLIIKGFECDEMMTLVQRAASE